MTRLRGQGDGDARTPQWAVGRNDRSTVSLGNGFRYGKSEAGTSGVSLPAFVQPYKPVENNVSRIGRYAGPIVVDDEYHRVVNSTVAIVLVFIGAIVWLFWSGVPPVKEPAAT